MRIPWRVSALTSAILVRGGQIAIAFVFAAATNPTDYAPVTLLVALTPLTALVATLGAEQSLFRRWASEPSPNRLRAEAMVGVVIAGAMSIVLLPLAGLIALLVSQDPGPFLIAAAAGVVQGCSLSLVLAWQRATQNSTGMLVLAATSAIAAAAVRLLCLFMDVPVAVAWVSGDLAASLVGIVAMVVWLTRAERGEAGWRAIVGYGAPMSLHGLWQWALGSADRFIFGIFLSASQVGTYGAAAQVSNGFNAVASEVNKSGLHRYARSGAQDSRSRDVVLLGGLWLIVAPFAFIALIFLQGQGYAGILMLGSALYLSMVPLVFYLPAANHLSVASGRSGWLSVASLAGCIVNVALNLALVSSVGLYAGAIANFVGYTTMTAVLMLIGRRLTDPVSNR